jgi:hypothetical protein
MKRITLTIGLLVLLLGIAAASQYGRGQTDIRELSIANNGLEDKAWNFTCSLPANEAVKFVYRQAVNWTEGYFDTPDDGSGMKVLWLYVYIIPVDPPGNLTLWDEELRVVTPPSGMGTGNPTLVAWSFELLQEGSIDPSPFRDAKGHIWAVGGITPFNGTYLIQVQTMPSRALPPSYIGLFHNVTTTIYPNSYLLPTGIVMVTFGGTLSFIGVRSVIQRSPKMKRKKP